MQQKANKLIVELIGSKEFKRCINKVQPSHLRRDLVSEISLILLETKPDKIIMMADKHQLKYYVVRIIMNLAFSNTSPFYKKYKMPVYDLNDESTKQIVEEIIDESDKVIARKDDEEKILSALDSVTDYGIALNEFDLDAYESQMVKLYVKYSNYRNMEKQTMIPYSSCFKTVTKAIIKIKNNL